MEDDHDLREMVEFVLTEADFEVIGYGRAAAFWEGLGMDKPDLILLDVMLPDGNGVDICKELHSARNTADIPILIMSAVHDHIDACADAEFVRKPFNIDDLVSRVRRRMV
ncbi:response regulator transcription factor [Parapedobacter sp.]